MIWVVCFNQRAGKPRAETITQTLHKTRQSTRLLSLNGGSTQSSVLLEPYYCLFGGQDMSLYAFSPPAFNFRKRGEEGEEDGQIQKRQLKLNGS